ncbi:LOW QUALITY PROTEIN: hypothetical protein U9M48_004831 [Paspalum notatum var. saurae]|uniref:Uncharacterized protein n=1 Tax=Paspalum notatum var. saurae TaxID=547442 RepID=A0AAQ3SF34_PASNO
MVCSPLLNLSYVRLKGALVFHILQILKDFSREHIFNIYYLQYLMEDRLTNSAESPILSWLFWATCMASHEPKAESSGGGSGRRKDETGELLKHVYGETLIVGASAGQINFDEVKLAGVDRDEDEC